MFSPRFLCRPKYVIIYISLHQQLSILVVSSPCLRKRRNKAARVITLALERSERSPSWPGPLTPVPSQPFPDRGQNLQTRLESRAARNIGCPQVENPCRRGRTPSPNQTEGWSPEPVKMWWLPLLLGAKSFDGSQHSLSLSVSIVLLLCNNIHKISPLDPVRSQSNVIHVLTSYVSRNQFNIFPSMPMPLKCSLPFGVSD